MNFLGNTTELNEIEKDVVSYLSDKQFVHFPEFKSHLEEKGYGFASILKATTSSPLVHNDKSRGRNHYRYSLVWSGLPTKDEYMDTERYTLYKSRLRRILEFGTDEPIESKRRREQGILQEWLFKDKEQEECAICHGLYNVSALVTAHKKRRSKCAEIERLDPYIVMPLCLFGCNYLYDNEFIHIENGVVKLNNCKELRGKEYGIAKSLEGNIIKDEWLQGGNGYFNKPDKNIAESEA